VGLQVSRRGRRVWRSNSLILKLRISHRKLNVSSKYVRVRMVPFQSSWRFVLCSFSSFLADSGCNAPYQQLCLTKEDIKYILSKLTTQSQALTPSIWWHISARQAFSSCSSLHCAHVSAFVSSPRFCFFTTSLLGALASAFARCHIVDVRKPRSMRDNNTRYSLCSSMLHYQKIDIEHKY
jgi:hypothetical protein